MGFTGGITGRRMPGQGGRRVPGGNRFRRTWGEVIGSGSGTHDLGPGSAEPIASGSGPAVLSVGSLRVASTPRDERRPPGRLREPRQGRGGGRPTPGGWRRYIFSPGRSLACSIQETSWFSSG